MRQIKPFTVLRLHVRIPKSVPAFSPQDAVERWAKDRYGDKVLSIKKVSEKKAGWIDPKSKSISVMVHMPGRDDYDTYFRISTVGI